MTHERYVTALAQQLLQPTLVTHEPIRTIDDVRMYAPELLETMVKTVAFRIKAGPLVLVALRGRDRVDYKRVAMHFGVNRRALRSLAPEQVSAELGVQPGGVAPIPLDDNQRLLIDQGVFALDVIHTGSGKFDVTFGLNPRELADAFSAEIVQVAK